LFAAIAILAIIILAAMAFVQKPLKLAIKCERCGLPACRRCNPELPNLSQCGQCYHAFVTKKGVEPALRIQKEIASHRYQASTQRLTRLFALLMAGAGQLTRGAALRGMFFVALFTSAVVGLLATLGFLPLPVTIGDPALDRITVIAIATVALVTYVAALWDGARER